MGGREGEGRRKGREGRRKGGEGGGREGEGYIGLRRAGNKGLINTVLGGGVWRMGIFMTSSLHLGFGRNARWS